MKFSKGFWKLQEDVTPIYPVRVHEMDVSDDALVAYLSSSASAARGDLMQGSLVTLRFSSPLPGVIHVQAEHLKGRQPLKPDFFRRNLRTDQRHQPHNGVPVPLQVPNDFKLLLNELFLLGHILEQRLIFGILLHFCLYLSDSTIQITDLNLLIKRDTSYDDITGDNGRQVGQEKMPDRYFSLLGAKGK